MLPWPREGAVADVVVDTRGLYCPVPVLRARDRLRSVAPGGIVEILSDDPAILEDMPAFCRSHGHEYLGHVEDAGAWRVRVRRVDRDHGA